MEDNSDAKPTDNHTEFEEQTSDHNQPDNGLERDHSLLSDSKVADNALDDQEKVPNPDHPPESSTPIPSHNIGDLLQKTGLNLIVVGTIALLGFFIVRSGFIDLSKFPPAIAKTSEFNDSSAQTLSTPEISEEDAPSVGLKPLPTPPASFSGGIFRLINLDTTIPSRPRNRVITYTVQTGDTLFSIADAYYLKPETLLWGNFDVLEDNPNFLSPDQVLNILPVDGTFYKWKENDDLAAIAGFYNVESQAITNYSGNYLDLANGEGDTPEIETGKWLIIPGGSRPIKDWGPPAISRTNPASARYYGEGHCGDVYEGAYGTGTYVWPTVDRSIVGYGYSTVHPAIDIGGSVGNSIFATDSGVVVYAGWSNYGYGNLIVIDHGNGWQSAYAHLSSVAVGCGQSVFQGGAIGGLGVTGRSSGPHLHFELAYNGAKENPINYLQ